MAICWSFVTLSGHFDGCECPSIFIKSFVKYFNIRAHDAGVGGSSPPVAAISPYFSSLGEPPRYSETTERCCYGDGVIPEQMRHEGANCRYDNDSCYPDTLEGGIQ